MDSRPLAWHTRLVQGACFHVWALAVGAAKSKENMKLKMRLETFMRPLRNKWHAHWIDSRGRAHRGTAGQLRLHLKFQGRDVEKDADPELRPKGLVRMSQAELIQQMNLRKLDPSGMTRAQMIRHIKLWATREQIIRDIELWTTKDATIKPESLIWMAKLQSVVVSMKKEVKTEQSEQSQQSQQSELSAQSVLKELNSSWMDVDPSARCSNASKQNMEKDKAGLDKEAVIREIIDELKEHLVKNPEVMPGKVFEHARKLAMGHTFSSEMVQMMVNTAATEVIFESGKLDLEDTHAMKMAIAHTLGPQMVQTMLNTVATEVIFESVD